MAPLLTILATLVFRLSPEISPRLYLDPPDTTLRRIFGHYPPLGRQLLHFPSDFHLSP